MMRRVWPLLILSGVLIGPLDAQAPLADDTDIQTLQDLNRRSPSEARAWRIVEMIQIRQAMSRTERRHARTRLQIAFDKLNHAQRRVLSGDFSAAMLNSRWGQAMVTAPSVEAQALFRRTLADQYDDAYLLTSEADRAAFAPLFLLAKAQIGRDNVLWLKSVLPRIGWFDITTYGADASMAAWLIVQHADFDPQWQAEMIERLRPRVARGDMQPSYFAYLVDRVAVNGHQPQDYGTQGRCANGAWQPYPMIEPERVDVRRATMGLEPLEAYRARFNCN